jgi:putative flippase GtrA
VHQDRADSSTRRIQGLTLILSRVCADSSTVTIVFARFVLVGASNTLLSLAVYLGLLALGTPYVVAAVLAFGAGAVNGYVLNRRWTFAAPDTPVARARYLAVQLGGAAVTSALLWLLVAEGGLGRAAGYVVTVPIVTVAMFVANRRWTFAARRAGVTIRAA